MKYRDPSTGNFKDLHFKVSDTLPIGTITQYGGATAPEGWLICDGSAVSRTSYSALFAAIGTTYGSGNGSTTFNLPDLRGRVGVGKSSDTEFDTLGETGGAKSNSYNLAHTHTQGDTGAASGNTGSTTLTINQIPSHAHTLGRTNNATAFQYYTGNIPYTNGTPNSGPEAETSYVGGGQGHTHSLNNHTHTNPVTNSALGSTSISTLSPYLVTNYIIKAYQVVAAPAKVSDLFPVGKVEIFFDNEDHSNYLGFTWERIAQGKTLIGIDSTDTDFDTIGETGGSKSNSYNLAHTHTQGNTGSTALTIDQIPPHNHSFTYDTTSGSTTGNRLAGRTVNNLYGTDTTTVGGGQGHTHTNPSTNSALGSTSISTLQPYIVVAYWRRVS